MPAVEETGRPRTCQLSLLIVWLWMPTASGHLDPLLVWYALPLVPCCCQNKFPVDFLIKFSPYQVGLYHRIQNGNSLSHSRVPASVQTCCSFIFLLSVIQRIALSRLCCFPFQTACWLKSEVVRFLLCGVGFRVHPKSTAIPLNPVQVSSI